MTCVLTASSQRLQVRIESVRTNRNVARTRLTLIYEHPPSGHSLTASVRQIHRFQGFQTAEQQDFHDAAELAAFWRLVGDPLTRLPNVASA